MPKPKLLKRSCILLVPIISSCVFACPAIAQTQYPAQVQDLSQDKYYPAVKQAIAGATTSIDAVLYLVNFDNSDKKSKVSLLVQELVNAAKRGIKVKVILDQNVDFAAWNKTHDPAKKEDKNNGLFIYLKNQGIEVYYDDLYLITHSKAIVIDQETVILGSTNWTDSSLNKNQETSCLIISADFAKEILADFRRIKLDSQTGSLDNDKNAVRINNLFLNSPALAPRMIANNDLTAFDMYLFLLKKYDGNPQAQIDIDYPETIAAFGLDKKLDYANAYDVLAKALARLEKTYRLIKRTLRYKQGPSCFLLDYRQNKPYQTPASGYCALPDQYWQYGWNNSLSFPEKYCLLISFARSLTKRGNTWTDYRQNLMEDFSIGKMSLIRGMKGLRALNIIEIEYPDYPAAGVYSQRGPMRFTLLGLYSPQDLEKQKAALSQAYGQEIFTTAQKHALIVFKAQDIQVIEDIIKKIDEYGPSQVARAFSIVGQKSAGNPKRSYKYVIGILKGSAGK